jgi:predicted 3-demethylubiquinone-9 3-methyltransferase (glyoxalase superfamily)
VAPAFMVDWFGDPNEKSERAMAAMMTMKKLDIAALEKTYHGK